MSDLQPNIIAKAGRLFQYLTEVQRLRHPRITTLETYKRDGSVVWHSTAPQHDAVRWDTVQGTSAQATGEDGLSFLTVERVHHVDPPAPPEDIAAWLEGDPRDFAVQPSMRPHHIIPAENPFDPPQTMNLDDHPHLRSLYDAWVARWDEWAEKATATQEVIELYDTLFSMRAKASQLSEEYEVVYGINLLRCVLGEDHIYRHVWTSPVTIHLDNSSGQLTVAPDESAPTPVSFEFDMIDPGLHPAQQLTSVMQGQTADHGIGLLQPQVAEQLGTEFMTHFNAHGQYFSALAAPPARPDPVMALSPALILRKRSQQGILHALASIRRQIETTGDVPSGILSLVDPQHVPSSAADSTPGALLAYGEDVFSPLPLNENQKRILEAVNNRAQTVVQGPPGTGKTHTAAALISHLLAQGKRVLITAHTDRALYEVRDKLPEPIKPLAVSVIGTSAHDHADLRTAVDSISQRLNHHDENQVRHQIETWVDEAELLEGQRHALIQRIVEEREKDQWEHHVDGYHGTAAAIGAALEQGRATHGWIAECSLPSDAPDECPLSRDTLSEWVGLAADDEVASADPERSERLCPLTDLPTPADFSALVSHVTHLSAQQQENTDLLAHPASASLIALDTATRTQLQQGMQAMVRLARDIQRMHTDWVPQALDDILRGVGHPWQHRCTTLGAILPRVAALVGSIPIGADVTCNSPMAPMTLQARHVRAHLIQKGPLDLLPTGAPKVGWRTPKVIKDAAPFFASVLVRGVPATTVDAIDAFLAHEEATRYLDELDRLWPEDVAICQEDTLQERLAWHEAQHGQLTRIVELAPHIESVEGPLRSINAQPPEWHRLDQVVAYATTFSAAETASTLTHQQAQKAQWVQALEPYRAAAGDAEPLHSHLAQAMDDLDPAAYSVRYAELSHAWTLTHSAQRLRELGTHCDELLPGLSRLVTQNPHQTTWAERGEHLHQSWSWLRALTWLQQREAFNVNEAQKSIQAIESTLRRHAANIAASRAWTAALDPARMTPQAKAHLVAYAQQVKKLGKGTGKYAAARRADIKRAMDQCRTAVPVWIMPVHRIVEQLPMEPNQFDVVIVDEASQAGVEACFLQYLAPKIVVIGDDQQVSPDGGFTNHQEYRDLAQQLLYDFDFKETWQDPARSFFDEAVMRFAGKIVLTEHRRCVPDIIGYSNRIAYEPHNIQLQPVRMIGSHALPPLVMKYLPDAREEGGSGTKINRGEAQAIVDAVLQCVNDSRYDNKSLGVITLQGTKQAKYIEGLLLAQLPQDVWETYQLRVGSASDFQGSERDVVFMSLVTSLVEGRIAAAFTKNTFVQRFNVAASRAKDQCWLFHSVTAQHFTNHDDVRWHLLDYYTSVLQRARQEGTAELISEDEAVDGYDSLFEQRVRNRIVERGYHVENQYSMLGYRIDLVVVTPNQRIAVECDGDHWHGPEQYRRDIMRQRDLERCGWTFYRVRESDYYANPAAALQGLWDLLDSIADAANTDEPSPTHDAVADAPPDTTHGASAHPAGPDDTPPTEPEPDAEPDHCIDATPAQPHTQPEDDADSAPAQPQSATASPRPEAEPASPISDSVTPEPSSVKAATAQSAASTRGNDAQEDDHAWLKPYPTYLEQASIPHTMTPEVIMAAVHVEGPITTRHLRDVMIKASGRHRGSQDFDHAFYRCVEQALDAGELEKLAPTPQSDALETTYKLPHQSWHHTRRLGGRTLHAMPLSELAAVMRRVRHQAGECTEDEWFRATLQALHLRRLTAQTRSRLTWGAQLADSAAHEEHCSGEEPITDAVRSEHTPTDEYSSEAVRQDSLEAETNAEAAASPEPTGATEHAGQGAQPGSAFSTPPAHFPGRKTQCHEYLTFTSSIRDLFDLPSTAAAREIMSIVQVEGPVMYSRLHTVTLQASHVQRPGPAFDKTFYDALTSGLQNQWLVRVAGGAHLPLRDCALRLPSQPDSVVRALGPREFHEVSEHELAEVLEALLGVDSFDTEYAWFVAASREYGVTRLTAPDQERLRRARDISGL